MASIFFVGVSKINPTGCLLRLYKTLKNHNVTQVAFLTRTAYQEPRNKPAPFPYWKKKFTYLHELTDPMLDRFDGNTKLVVVDGPPAIGKSKLCEHLANEFGLLYMPAPTQDDLYINSYGFDIRELDSKLPFYTKSFDVPRFLENPDDKRAAYFQKTFFLMRFEQYLNALLHLLSTGQGVILDRSAYSDIVFAQAMANAGYLSELVLQHYMYMRELGLDFLLKPHLIIYLDVPAELVKEKIKQKGRPYEVNSKVFSTQFLTDMENIYKEQILKKLGHHSHLLIYDWSKAGDLTTVVENIEEIDFDNYEDNKLSDWVFNTTGDLLEVRHAVDSKRPQMFMSLYDSKLLSWPRELYWETEEERTLKNVLENCPSEKYEEGFNPDCGDQVLWKIPSFKRFTLRRTPCDFVNRSKYMSN
ncbi:NADH dehydrogenase (ubiquinone) subunit ND-42 [Ptiloglossa arizonensis]|uniref:NADH dehydrogenase (ubiquinone) subunit ND-42 n=1 Tax=Ptiloglossa arizonensis TaxID=3350558 RepID=UPI003FA0298F